MKALSRKGSKLETISIISDEKTIKKIKFCKLKEPSGQK
jgi:hypothetical protein